MTDTDLRTLAEQATPHTVSRLNYKDGRAILALLDERDHWHQQFIVNRDLAAAAERRVAALEEGLGALLPLVPNPKPPKNGPAWQVDEKKRRIATIEKARALLAAEPSEPPLDEGINLTDEQKAEGERRLHEAGPFSAPAALPAEVGE